MSRKNNSSKYYYINQCPCGQRVVTAARRQIISILCDDCMLCYDICTCCGRGIKAIHDRDDGLCGRCFAHRCTPGNPKYIHCVHCMTRSKYQMNHTPCSLTIKLPTYHDLGNGRFLREHPCFDRYIATSPVLARMDKNKRDNWYCQVPDLRYPGCPGWMYVRSHGAIPIMVILREICARYLCKDLFGVIMWCLIHSDCRTAPKKK